LSDSSDKPHNILIWDAEGSPPVGDCITLLWSCFESNSDKRVISIPRLVEEQSVSLKSRFLAWVYDIGEKSVDGKRLLDILELRPGLSYWWMTSLSQKFNASAESQIDNVIKSFVLEQYIIEQRVAAVNLVTDNKKLILLLKKYCKRAGLGFKWEYRKKKIDNPETIARRLYSALPYLFQALIFLSLNYLKGSFYSIRRNQPTASLSGDISFIDILVHLDRRSFTTKTFISGYWTSLVDQLALFEVKANWFHNYYYQESIPTFRKAHDLLQAFNKRSRGLQCHMLMESCFNFSVFRDALKTYFRLGRIHNQLSIINSPLFSDETKFDYWTLLKDEWVDSLRGKEAMVNCLRIALFEKVFNQIPHQRIGVYIQENQPWEMALIHFWKSSGHGMLIGVPHTSVRYWDLRYFHDQRYYDHKKVNNNELPVPDLMALNGPVATKIMIDHGYPQQQLTEVEALRFQHLLNQKIYKNETQKNNECSNRVLVCGDFLSKTNKLLLTWLSEALCLMTADTFFLFKPHPACPVDMSAFPSLQLEVSNAPLHELIGKCDVVFTSNVTSAAVDAYFSNVPVVQILDGNSLNMSPLRGLRDVVYVTNPYELAQTLNNVNQRRNSSEEPYFYLDRNLPRWNRLLGLSNIETESMCNNE